MLFKCVPFKIKKAVSLTMRNGYLFWWAAGDSNPGPID